MRIANQDWILTATRNMSFWHQCISDEGYYPHTADFGVEVRPYILHLTIDGTKTTLFHTEPNLTEYGQAILAAVSSEEKIKQLKHRYQQKSVELFTALENCRQALTLENWDAFSEEYRGFTSGLLITTVLGRVGTERLTEKLQQLGYPAPEIPNIIGTITYPAERTPFFCSQLDLLKIGERIQTNPEALRDELLEQWLEKYGCIPVNFCEEPWTMAEAVQQLEQTLQMDCSAEISVLEANHAKGVENAASLIEELGNEDVQILAHALAEGTYLNEFRKNVFSRVSLAYRPLFAKIAAGAGSDNWRDCFYLTPDEIRQILQGNAVDLVAIKAKRKVAGGYIDDEGRLALLTDEQAGGLAEYIRTIQGQNSSGEVVSGLIAGFSACKGVVTGIARIVLSSHDFHKMQAGDILVAPMTSVDFVPIMKMAGAFVTNEGGITSHASIVAREMNKPCIIGTKNATQIIKDGDYIEVDGNSGKVTILAKAK